MSLSREYLMSEELKQKLASDIERLAERIEEDHRRQERRRRRLQRLSFGLLGR